MAESDRLDSESKSAQNFYTWELNPQTKQILVSAITEGLVGFPFESNLESMLAAIHPADLAALTDKIHRALEGLEPLEEEVRYIHPATGEIFWFRIEGQLSYNDDASTRLIGVAHNITGQKRAEELSAEQLRAFFENAGVGMAQIDADLRFLRVNERFCQITGYSREELLSMTPLDLDHTDEREVDRERIRRFFEGTGQIYDFEKRYVRKDGRVTWVHVTVTLVRDAGGKPLQTAAVIDDITSRKEAEERIGQKNVVLEGINRIFCEALTCQTEDEIRRVCLQVAVEVTGSVFGNIGMVNDRGLLDSIVISDKGIAVCKMENKQWPTDVTIHGIYGRVITDGIPVLTNNPGSHPDSIGTPPGHPPIQAFLGVPLKEQGKTIGIIGVANREGGYRKEDMEVLEALSKAMVQALMRWRANKLAEDYALLARLHEVSTQLDDNIDAIFNAVLDAAVTITRADGGAIQLLDETGQLCLLAVKNIDQRVLDRFSKVSIESGTSCAEAMRLKQRVIVDYQTDMRFAQYTESSRVLNAAGIQVVQSTPLVSRTGRLIGMLSTHWREPHQPADRVLLLVDFLARQAADLIERKQAEDKLRKSEERFRALVMASSELLYCMSPDWSEMRTLHCRHANEERPNPTWLNEYIHPDDHPQVTAVISEAIRTKSIFELEHRFQRVDGSLGWTFSRAVPLINAQGDIIEWFGAASDISGRKYREANDALIAEITKEYMRCSTVEEIMQTTGEKIGPYLGISRCHLGDIDDESSLGTITYDWHKEGLPSISTNQPYPINYFFTEELCEIARQGKFIVVNDVYQDINANKEVCNAMFVRSYITVPLIKDGQWRFLLGVSDITPRIWRDDEVELVGDLAGLTYLWLERARTEAALRESEERYRALAEDLQLADRRKDEFIGILSHEIRNPLTTIKLGMTMLNRSSPESEQASRVREIIERQVAQLSRLIDDLLDVTRIARNKIALQKGAVELNELVRKTAQDYLALFQERGLQLEVNCSPDPLHLEADAVRLAQVVGNLLHNAVKFTLNGGGARVIVAEDETRQSAMIRIKDTGMGIVPELLSNIFVPFMQADTSLDRGQSGLGLGLALVKGLVELHGGDVTVRSGGPGKGAEFTIRLPLNGKQTTAKAPEAIPAIPGCSRRILVIEDIIDVAYMIKSLLEKEGHEVMVAHNGRQGITLARTFQPEVLLCDIGLPGMDGYEVARTFRTDEELKQVYLVSITGYARPEDLRRAREAGFHCQLAKPVDLNILKQTLANLSFS